MKVFKIAIVSFLLVLFLTPQLFAGSALSTKPKAKETPPTSSQKMKTATPPVKKQKKAVKKLKCKALKIKMPSNLPDGNEKSPYEIKIKLSGGVKPFSFKKLLRSVLPELKFSEEGILSGKLAKPGSYQLKIQVSDSCTPSQTVKKSFKITVLPANVKKFTKKQSEMTHRSSPKTTSQAEMPISSLKQKKKTMPLTQAPALGPKTKPLPVAGQVALSKAGPQIESLFTAPIGALRPLTKLYLKGKFFGKQPGKIILYSDTKGSIDLQNVEWKNEKNVNGVVPASTEKWPNQTLTVKIKSADNRLSNPMKIGFGAREEAWLEMEDVIIEKCGRDGNKNRCNHQYGGSCSGHLCRPIEPDDDFRLYAIAGEHCNNWGAVGDDYGVDRYRIRLQNGWVIKSTELWKSASSWGEVYFDGPIPRIPVGKSDVAFEFAWEVSPNDRVCYNLKVKLEGPAGTYYK